MKNKNVWATRNTLVTRYTLKDFGDFLKPVQVLKNKVSNLHYNYVIPSRAEKNRPLFVFQQQIRTILNAVGNWKRQNWLRL